MNLEKNSFFGEKTRVFSPHKREKHVSFLRTYIFYGFMVLENGRFDANFIVAISLTASESP